MNKVFSDESWSDYLWWQKQDRKTLKRINALIKSIERDGASLGIGKPEALRGELSGLWSRDHVENVGVSASPAQVRPFERSAVTA